MSITNKDKIDMIVIPKVVDQKSIFKHGKRRQRKFCKKGGNFLQRIKEIREIKKQNAIIQTARNFSKLKKEELFGEKDDFEKNLEMANKKQSEKDKKLIIKRIELKSKEKNYVREKLSQNL